MVRLVIWLATPSKFRLNCDEPVGRRLHELHQFVPRRPIGRPAVQRVEQEFGIRGLRGAGENDEGESEAEGESGRES